MTHKISGILIHTDSGKILPGRVGESYFIDNVAAIQEAERLSTCLIDNSRKRGFSWGAAHGFIIESPVQSVVATSSRDMWSKMRTLSELSELWPVTTPEEVLYGPSSWPVNNEVVIVPENMVITGLFVTREHRDWDMYSQEYLHGVADELEVPLVCINPFED